MNSKKVQKTIQLHEDTINKIESLQKIQNNVSRNTIIEDAINLYYGYKTSEIPQDFLCSVYGSKVEGIMGKNFSSLERLLYKQALEINILVRVIGSNFNVDKDTYNRLRRIAVDDTKGSKGILSVFDAQL